MTTPLEKAVAALRDQVVLLAARLGVDVEPVVLPSDTPPASPAKTQTPIRSPESSPPSI